jgi:hypothetical protein
MAHIVQISGKKGHGKSTVAELLKIELGERAKIYNFADPLKQILAATLNISVEELEANKNLLPQYRSMLQRLGTEGLKPIFGDDVWLKLAQKYCETLCVNCVLIIPDWRFKVEAIEDSLKVRIHRPSVPESWDSHASEIELDTFEGFDYTLINDGDVTTLLQKVKELAVIIDEKFPVVEITEDDAIIVAE